MQIKTYFISGILITASLLGLAQTAQNSIDDKQDTSRKKVKKSEAELKYTEVNFLFNYYEQDGDHSPVTGGIGTEKLDNIASAIVVHIPIESIASLDLDIGIDFYTSASTDKIDYFQIHKTKASGKDARGHINAAYNRQIKQSGNTYGILTGFSIESDVTSISFGSTYTLNSKDQNQSLNLHAHYFNDTWKLYYPVEKRDGTQWLKDDIRKTLKIALSYSRIINKRLQALFTIELVTQSGLLSTPFHRVFFDNALGKEKNDLKTLSNVEILNDKRLKIPVSMRWNYYLNDFIRVRSFYRYYTDSWGISAHTASIEMPMQVSTSLIASPFFRYHTQTAADDFYKFGQASNTQRPEFYTSDYDLSDLNSTKIGLGLQYSPVMGVGIFKSRLKTNKQAQFKSIGLRTAYYDRSDGLNAWLVSLDFAFSF